MATGAIIGGSIALAGLGFQVGGSIVQAVKDKKDSEAAEDFGNQQFDQNVSNINQNYAETIRQSQAKTDLALDIQNSNFESIVRNARESASFQLDTSVENISQQSTQQAALTRAVQSRSGASGQSSALVRTRQKSNVSREANRQRTGIELNLEQTEESAELRLSNATASIELQQQQILDSALISRDQSLDQAELNQIAATANIPTTGEIAGTAALDILAQTTNFSSQLLDIYG